MRFITTALTTIVLASSSLACGERAVYTFEGEFEAKIDMDGDGNKDLISAIPRYVFPDEGESYINRWEIVIHPWDEGVQGYLVTAPIFEIEGENLVTAISDTDGDGDRDITLYLDGREILFEHLDQRNFSKP